MNTKNTAQLAFVYHSARQRGVTTENATALLIEEIFGQVQAVIACDATSRQLATQVGNVLALVGTRSDVSICLDTYRDWVRYYTLDTTILPNGVRFTKGSLS